MKTQEWIDSFTRAVALKWTIYNVWRDKFYSMTLLAESPTPGVVYSTQLQIESTYFYNKRSMVLDLISTILLLVVTLLYSVKTAFELNLGWSLGTNTLEVVHIAMVFLACGMFVISILSK